MKFVDVIWSVEKQAILALAIVAVLVGVYIELDFSVSARPGIDGTFFLLGSAAAFLYGVLPVTLYGAPLYAWHLVQPKFGFALVLIAAFIPGLLWVLAAQPERNVALFLTPGPAIAIILHWLCSQNRGLIHGR